MTLEEFLIAILWVIVGSWVAYKRNWYESYKNSEETPQFLLILVTIIGAPVALAIAIFEEMVLDSWNNTKRF